MSLRPASLPCRIGLLITIGYFRATKRFFTYPFHPTDVEDAALRLGCLLRLIDMSADDAKAASGDAGLLLPRPPATVFLIVRFIPFARLGQFATKKDLGNPLMSSGVFVFSGGADGDKTLCGQSDVCRTDR